MPTYTTHLLPVDDVALLPRLAAKYTQLRIKGLIQSPEAFSATLEGEQALTLEEQQERIHEECKHVVVAVLNDDDDDDDDDGARPWYEHEWVAQATLYGPRSWQAHVLPFKTAHATARQLSDDDLTQTTLTAVSAALSSALASKGDTAYWHMTALYVDADHRRRGLAKQLCTFAYDVIKAKSPDAKRAELRIIVKSTNTPVVAMYDKQLGFAVVQQHRSTLAEATIAAGDAAILPADYNERDAYTTRVGIIMVKDIAF